MAPRPAPLRWAVFVALDVAVAAAEGLTRAHRGSFLAERGVYAADLSFAMGTALGCGGHVEQSRLDDIERTLLPIWRSVPKNGRGRIERRLLRYLTYRYFQKTSSLIIRGLEPSRSMNASSWGEADILSQRVPEYVESVLQSRHVDDHGFDLGDVTLMVATVEQLIFDSETALLEKVYARQRKPMGRELTRQGLQQVLEAYMVYWMVADELSAVDSLLNDRDRLHEAIPHWDSILHFTRGEIIAYDYYRQRQRGRGGGTRRSVLTRRYSFDDVHRIVGEMTKTFASFWESECSRMKMPLIEIDTHNTGRVPLARFYSSALNADEWRFGESEGYLRDMGVLDETSMWMGKQVIIPNYLQAASNCIVTHQHYLLCCANDCEGVFAEIEAAVGAPLADPEQVLDLVGNMSSQTTVEHDDLPDLTGTLTQQLHRIADAQGGKVPLHGRLFAQWLHYVYPRDCPFPHKSGTVSMVTPSEFGDGYIATMKEMQEHASKASKAKIPASMDKDEIQWMSQWSPEEELLTDYHQSHRWADWAGAGCALALVSVFAAITASRADLFSGSGRFAGGPPEQPRTHSL